MKKRIFRNFFWVSILLLLLVVCIQPNSSWSAEEKYPSRPIEMVCLYTPGGVTDLINRLIAQSLEKHLGVPVVPVNKPGGGGVVGTSYIVHARPDGYTSGTCTDVSLLAHILTGRATYSLKDVRIVGRINYSSNFLIVSADSPWKTFQEFVDYVRKNPGAVKYSHPGPGAFGQLATAVLCKYANLKMVGIPFPGGPEIVSAVLGKHVDVGAVNAMDARAQADAGKCRVIYSFSPPAKIGFDPTIASPETFFGKGVIPDFDVSTYVLMPGGTPDEIVQVLERALEKAAKEPEWISANKKWFTVPEFIDGNTITQKILPEKKVLMEGLLKDLGLLK